MTKIRKRLNAKLKSKVAVESVHYQFRKLTKTKGAFLNEISLLKLLYIGILNASEK